MANLQPALAPEAKHHHYWPIVVGILLLLVVAVGIGYLATTASQAPAPVEVRNPLAVNPELMILPLYEGVASRNALAVNPELMAFQAYTWQKEQPRDFLAINPELSSYYRYANK